VWYHPGRNHNIEIHEWNVYGGMFMNDKPTTYLTILTKNSIFSFLGLVRAEMIGVDESIKPVTAVVKLDPREGEPLLKQYETRGEAMRNYEEAISTSLDRGWSIVYRGRPMFG
jgi:hypothetical protein